MKYPFEIIHGIIIAKINKRTLIVGTGNLLSISLNGESFSMFIENHHIHFSSNTICSSVFDNDDFKNYLGIHVDGIISFPDLCVLDYLVIDKSEMTISFNKPQITFEYEEDLIHTYFEDYFYTVNGMINGIPAWIIIDTALGFNICKNHYLYHLNQSGKESIYVSFARKIEEFYIYNCNCTIAGKNLDIEFNRSNNCSFTKYLNNSNCDVALSPLCLCNSIFCLDFKNKKIKFI